MGIIHIQRVLSMVFTKIAQGIAQGFIYIFENIVKDCVTIPKDYTIFVNGFVKYCIGYCTRVCAKQHRVFSIYLTGYMGLHIETLGLHLMYSSIVADEFPVGLDGTPPNPIKKVSLKGTWKKIRAKIF